MRLTFDTLVNYPVAFHALIGKPAAEFRQEASRVGGTLHANRSAQQNRPGRRRAPGAGRPFALSGFELFLCVHLAVRFGSFWGVKMVMGVSPSTVARAVSRVWPELQRGNNPPISLPSDVRRSLMIAALNVLPVKFHPLRYLLGVHAQWVVVDGILRDAITGQAS
jgi:hypothetical protein